MKDAEGEPKSQALPRLKTRPASGSDRRSRNTFAVVLPEIIEWRARWCPRGKIKGERLPYWLGFSEIVASTGWFYSYLDSLAAVTAEDVQRVAQQYLAKSKRTVGWYVPQG